MRLTVLGKSPSWEDAGGACSGYLVEEGRSSALIDCGNGVFSKLRRYRDYRRVDAVVVSHMHADHFLDLIPYAYALTYSPRQQAIAVPGRPGPEAHGRPDRPARPGLPDRPAWPGLAGPRARPRLFVPPKGGETLRRVTGAWGSEDLVEKAFAVEEYEPSSTPRFGDLGFFFCEVPHFARTFAIGVESARGGGRLVYGADSGPSEKLGRFAHDADTFLIEATLVRPEANGPRGHLTPREAGEHGRAARAKRLVLTHISDELDPAWALREAAAAFGAPVEIAREGAVYEM